jgi:hypothetical protein
MNFDHLQEVFSLSCRKPFAEIFSMNPARETRFETVIQCIYLCRLEKGSFVIFYLGLFTSKRSVLSAHRHFERRDSSRQGLLITDSRR